MDEVDKRICQAERNEYPDLCKVSDSDIIEYLVFSAPTFLAFARLRFSFLIMVEELDKVAGLSPKMDYILNKLTRIIDRFK